MRSVVDATEIVVLPGPRNSLDSSRCTHVGVVKADEKPAPKSSEKKKADEKSPLKIEKPFLWKVEKAESTDSAAKVSWLFGTIHVPDEEVTTLHPAAQAAFDQASAAYFEIDF